MTATSPPPSHTPPPPERRRNGVKAWFRRHVLRRTARAQDEIRKLEFDRDIVMACLIIGILFLSVLSAYMLHQQSKTQAASEKLDVAVKQIKRNQAAIKENQKMIVALELRDRINSYRTAYRFCTRINVDRAAIHSLATRASRSKNVTPRVRKFARKFLRKLQSREGSPVLDCTPNTVGAPAEYQSPAKQRRFVRRWEQGKLSRAEIGICSIRIESITAPQICIK